MRELSDTLTAAQKKRSLDPMVKITLSLAGEDDVVLECDRLKYIKHIEEPWRVNAKGVELDNSTGFFSDKDLKAYQAVVSYGLVTKAGWRNASIKEAYNLACCEML